MLCGSPPTKPAVLSPLVCTLAIRLSFDINLFVDCIHVSLCVFLFCLLQDNKILVELRSTVCIGTGRAFVGGNLGLSSGCGVKILVDKALAAPH